MKRREREKEKMMIIFFIVFSTLSNLNSKEDFALPEMHVK